MAANNGDLVQSLIEGGLAPQAARILGNVLANANSPAFSKGQDEEDATPTEMLRLINSDARRYMLKNLDFTPQAPFQRQIESTVGQYAGPPPDHPYKDSQPVSSAAPLAAPRIQAGDYVSVDTQVDGNAAVSKVGLRLRLQDGNHLRIDPSTKFLDAIRFAARTETPQFLAAEFVDSGPETMLLVSLRNLEQVTLLLANGDSRQAYVFPEADATGPDGAAAGGSRSLSSVNVQLANGQTQELYALPKATATSPATGPVALQCRAYAWFSMASVLSVGGENQCLISASANIDKIVRTATGNGRVYFTNALPDNSYLAFLQPSHSASDNLFRAVVQHRTYYEADGFHFATWGGGSPALRNPERIHLAVFA